MNKPGKVLAKADACFESVRNQPDWWAPVWQGLVLDRQGRHYRRIKSALWLLIYLILCADRQTGNLKRRVSTISQGMGVKSRTIRTWLRTLQKGEYIDARTNGRCLVITIRKWKTFSQRRYSVRQSDANLQGRVTGLCQSESVPKVQESPHSSDKSTSSCAPNDITIKKKRLRNDNVRDQGSSKNQESAFAQRICQAFKDEANLPLYLAYVRQYPPEIIQKAFEEAMKPPANKIKKTRGALFNYLVKFYAKEGEKTKDHSH